MKVSIITINFNNAVGLEITLKSVISQTVKSYEYIIIDGGSTDSSKNIIEQYLYNISYWVSERDSGIYNAMNKGVAKATGEYLIFLNSGDSFSDPEALQRCYDHIEKHPNADIYYGDIYVVNDIKSAEKWLKVHPKSLSLYFFKHNTINHQASLIKSELFREISIYPESYKVASDYWFFLKCFIYNKTFNHIGCPMVDYDLSGISSSNYKLYNFEKLSIWNSLIPTCVQEIISECEVYKKERKELTGYRIIRYAMKLNAYYQGLKK